MIKEKSIEEDKVELDKQNNSQIKADTENKMLIL